MRRPRRAVAVVLAVVVAVLVLRWQVIGVARVEGTSMRPGLVDGDVLLYDRTGTLDVHTGDVVVLRDPADGGPAVKRVVATGGQTVAIEDAVLVVDGAPRTEPDIDSSRIDGTYFGPVRVPPGSVFVLGDDRRASVDSRAFGPVPRADVLGRVVAHLPW